MSLWNLLWVQVQDIPCLDNSWYRPSSGIPGDDPGTPV
jgi:hypothetical protein